MKNRKRATVRKGGGCLRRECGEDRPSCSSWEELPGPSPPHGVIHTMAVWEMEVDLLLDCKWNEPFTIKPLCMQQGRRQSRLAGMRTCHLRAP